MLGVATASAQPIFLSPMAESEFHQVISQTKFDLSRRWENEGVSQGFEDNIILALYYLKEPNQEPVKKTPLKHEEIEKLAPDDFSVEFELKPGQAFAFHNNILPEYQNRVVKTMESQFMTYQGYRVVSGLGGNGVCHLASLINWAASEAGLAVEARADHSFARIEGVPREYWTSIRYSQSGGNSQNQNLYIVNNQDFTVRFVFKRMGNELELRLEKI